MVRRWLLWLLAIPVLLLAQQLDWNKQIKNIPNLLRDTGGNGIVKRTALNTTAVAAGTDLPAHASNHASGGSDPITALGAVTMSGANLSSGTVPVAALVAGDYSAKLSAGSYAINTSGSAASLSANLPVSKLNSGTSASSSTFWRGDGTWAVAAETTWTADRDGGAFKLSNLGSLYLKQTAVTLANGANNDVNIGSSSHIRSGNPTGAYNITGFTGGADGRVLFLFNAVAFALTIRNANAGSTAANRIFTCTGADVVLRAGNSFALFIYDAGLNNWVLVASN